MEIIVSSIVAGSFTIVVALIQRSRKENKKDHNNVMDHMQLVSHEIRKDLRQIRYEIRDHRNELKFHIRKDHGISDSIPTTDTEAVEP